MVFSKAIFFLLTVSILSFAEAEAPPNAFDKELFLYKVVKKVAFDADQAFKDMGLKVHSCKIATSKKEYAFNSLGNCLLVAIDSSIKNQNYSSVKLWVLNDQGQYLNPLEIKWQVAQKSWLKFIYEFVELSFEDFFNYFRKKNPVSNACAIQPNEFLTKDIGNFIGNIEIRAQSPWRLSDYFKNEDLFKTQQFKNANGLELTVKSPEYANGKKIYEARAVLNNSINSSVSDAALVLNIRSNYNLLLSRDYCVAGHAELVRPVEEKP